MDEDNGILSLVPGQYIAQAQIGLAAPSTSTEGRVSVLVDAGHVGRVRIHCERKRLKHNKHAHWVWVAYRADLEP